MTPSVPSDPLAGCSNGDFDGHTDFKRLTPEQKLAWLSAVVRLAYNVRNQLKKT